MNEAEYAKAIANVGLPTDLEFRVTVSQRRRTVGLIAEPGGSLTIRVPDGMAVLDLTCVLARRMPWIMRSTAHRAGLTADHAVKEIVDGENFPFLGRNRRLVLDGQDDTVRLAGDRLILSPASPGTCSTRIIRWYTREGRAWLGERVPLWCRRVGVLAAKAEVSNLGQRWGICEGGDDYAQIVLHWASFQLPPHLINLVVVHELAHLAQPRHGPDFNQIVRRVLPAYEERFAELAEVGRHVWIGALTHQ